MVSIGHIITSLLSPSFNHRHWQKIIANSKMRFWTHPFASFRRCGRFNNNISQQQQPSLPQFCRSFSSSSKKSSSTSSSSSSASSSSSWSFLSWYSKKLDSHPYLTKGITSGLISLTGDIICQYLTLNSSSSLEVGNLADGSNSDTTSITSSSGNNNNNSNNDSTTIGTTASFDWARTFRFFIMGAFWVAPVTNFWYTALSTHIVPSPPTTNNNNNGSGNNNNGRSVSLVAKRLMIDQFIFAPIFIHTFMGLLWTLEGSTPIGEIPQRLASVAPEMLVANWSLWIPAMSINFGFVPLKYQVLYGNVVALIWNVYLSYMSVAG